MIEIEQILNRNILEIIEKDSLERKLKSGELLRVKHGVDPTGSDLHIGHAVPLWKLKEFQDAGHKAIFLIGDYTARIGDPSGRNVARKFLSEEEVEKNIATWLDQAGKILDLDSCEVRYNSEWYSKMKFADVLNLFGKVSLSNVIEREDFKRRLSAGGEVSFVESIYPIMQGYDSVALQADVEIGGYDQKLNLMMGRDLQRRLGQAPQNIITLPLLMGTDGKKMSKSEGNYIGLNDEPNEMYGKVMSISDDLIEQYLELATDFSSVEIEQKRKILKDGENPKKIKEEIACRIVEMYYGENKAKRAAEHFNRVFRDKQVPDKLKEITVLASDLFGILVSAGLASSRSDARRLVEQNGVRVDGKIVDLQKTLEVGKEYIVQVGKLKFAKVKIK